MPHLTAELAVKLYSERSRDDGKLHSDQAKARFDDVASELVPNPVIDGASFTRPS